MRSGYSRDILAPSTLHFAALRLAIFTTVQILITSCYCCSILMAQSCTRFQRIWNRKRIYWFRSIIDWFGESQFEYIRLYKSELRFAQHFCGRQSLPKSATLLNYGRRDTKHVTRRMNPDPGKAPAIKRDVITARPLRHLAADAEKKKMARRYGSLVRAWPRTVTKTRLKSQNHKTKDRD